MWFPETIPTKKNPGYATYVPGRKPEFKAHTTFGLAKTALTFHGFDRAYRYGETKFLMDMALYKIEIEDGEPIWKRVAVIEKGTDKSDYPEIWPN